MYLLSFDQIVSDFPSHAMPDQKQKEKEKKKASIPPRKVCKDIHGICYNANKLKLEVVPISFCCISNLATSFPIFGVC